jgi:hypothetical protein
MTGGTALSERERERQTRAGGGRPLLGRAAGPSAGAGEGAGERADQLGRTTGEKKIGPSSVFVFLFQNFE